MLIANVRSLKHLQTNVSVRHFIRLDSIKVLILSNNRQLSDKIIILQEYVIDFVKVRLKLRNTKKTVTRIVIREILF